MERAANSPPFFKWGLAGESCAQIGIKKNKNPPVLKSDNPNQEKHGFKAQALTAEVNAGAE